MESDIAPIFNTKEDPRPIPEPDDKPLDSPVGDDGVFEEDDIPSETPLENVIQSDASFYHHPSQQAFPPHPPHPQVVHPHTPMYYPFQMDNKQEVKWDPFSAIGVTSWFVISIAFMMGFLIGKLR